mgnify:CR=1 FL=1
MANYSEQKKNTDLETLKFCSPKMKPRQQEDPFPRKNFFFSKIVETHTHNYIFDI